MKYSFLALSIVLCLIVKSQNDVDAMRYSQAFFGGSSRSKAMAGSFGALGADGSCMSINPAGIGLYKKGELNISLGLKADYVTATHNGTTQQANKVNPTFNGITAVKAWDSKLNPDNHHAFGFSVNQLNNYNSTIKITGSSNRKSIMQDVLATAGTTPIKNLDASFAGLAYEVYLLDTINGKYYSLVNTKYSVLQSKTIEQTGRNNQWCFNYAYGFKDKLYFGATLAFSAINYKYSSTYTEQDTNDSIKKTNYNYPVWYYPSQKIGGFKDLSYQEIYSTKGIGTTLKLGVIYRATDFIRVGLCYNSPTLFNLTDTYFYFMNASYDEGGTPKAQYPVTSLGGQYSYKITTPSKLTGSIAFLFQKYGALNIDYDFINYKKASLKSADVGVFDGVNQTIQNKYSKSSNIRVGAEANIKPIVIRLGYAMYGSPFGNTFTGDFITSFFTGGIGYRKDNKFIDLCITQRFSKESYYMYNPNYVDKSNLQNTGTTVAVTIGKKF